MFEAAFFDLDGTLVDSEALSMHTGAAAFAAQGHHDIEDLLHQLIGVDQYGSNQLIRARCPGIDIDELRRAWHEAFMLGEAEAMPLKPGAFELVHGLAKKMPVALVTSSHREPALKRIELVGLRPAFSAVITRDDVTHAKPAPDPYLQAASLLGINPAKGLVFEDSEPGTQAGFHAGMTVVQVPDLVPASGRYAHHVADSLFQGAAWAGVWPL